LPDEKTNPAGKARAVNVNQSIAERSLENAGKVIAARKAYKNGEERCLVIAAQTSGSPAV
jgi:hypothetical protein